jgi:hypothetical protein
MATPSTAHGTGPSGRLTMYTTTWCGFCRRLKSQLARDGIEMVEVDIERDPEAADFGRDEPERQGGQAPPGGDREDRVGPSRSRPAGHRAGGPAHARVRGERTARTT